AAGIESLRRHVGDRAVRGPAAHDDATRLIRPQLRPVEVVAVPAQHLVAHVDGAFEQQVRGDGRRPGAVVGCFLSAHFCGRRTTSASPCPPPPHSAAAPVRRPRRFSSFARVKTRRAPLAPIGCPSATAPPLTLTRSSSIASIRVAFSATAANASLISTRSRSSTSRPAFFSALLRARAGTVCSHAYRSALMPWATISTSGSAASFRARSLDITTTAAAPSEICDALPAVIVPFFLNAGASLLSDSTVVSGRMPSSRSSLSTGTTSSFSAPPFDHALAAR